MVVVPWLAPVVQKALLGGIRSSKSALLSGSVCCRCPFASTRRRSQKTVDALMNRASLPDLPGNRACIPNKIVTLQKGRPNHEWARPACRNKRLLYITPDLLGHTTTYQPHEIARRTHNEHTRRARTRYSVTIQIISLRKKEFYSWNEPDYRYLYYRSCLCRTLPCCCSARSFSRRRCPSTVYGSHTTGPLIVHCCCCDAGLTRLVAGSTTEK
jgi:hypothetical protein